MKIFKKLFPSVLLIIILLFIWEIIVAVWKINPHILPAPSAVFSAFVDHFDILLPHIGQTILETLIGLLLAIILGVSLAVMISLSPLIRKALYPILVTSQTIPLIALAPLLLIWFGFTLLPKVIIVMLYCFFPITVALVDGMEKINPQAIHLLRSMGATKWQIIRLARFPGSLPSFFSGLRIAATYSVTGAIVGEYVGAYQGLGIYMQTAAHSYAIALVFAIIVITSVLSLLLFGLVSVLENIFVPWQKKEKESLF